MSAAVPVDGLTSMPPPLPPAAGGAAALCWVEVARLVAARGHKRRPGRLAWRFGAVGVIPGHLAQRPGIKVPGATARDSWRCPKAPGATVQSFLAASRPSSKKVSCELVMECDSEPASGLVRPISKLRVSKLRDGGCRRPTHSKYLGSLSQSVTIILFGFSVDAPLRGGARGQRHEMVGLVNSI